jgi:hypothetical protein
MKRRVGAPDKVKYFVVKKMGWRNYPREIGNIFTN